MTRRFRVAERRSIVRGVSAVALLGLALVTTAASLGRAAADSGDLHRATPTSCRGWEAAAAALQIDVLPNASLGAFNSKNAAQFETSALRTKDGQRPTAASLSGPGTLDCQGFDLAGAEASQPAANVQLRLSFAGQGPAAGEDLIIVRTSKNGSTWTARTTLLLAGEISNATNGGYFTVPLPDVRTIGDLRQLRVELLPNLSPELMSSRAQLDGLAVDLSTTRPADQEILNIQPLACAGWSNAASAAVIDVSGSAEAFNFPTDRSAIIERRTSEGMSLDSSSGPSDLSCAGFPVMSSTAGRDIFSARIVASLAATSSSLSEDVLTLSYSVDSGQTWKALDGIVLSGQVSNAGQGGYREYALPEELTREDLANLAVKATYLPGDFPVETRVLLDGLRLDLTASKPANQVPFGLSFLAKRYFLPIEEPVLFIEGGDLVSLEVVDAAGQPVDLPVVVTPPNLGRTKLKFGSTREFRPGTYTVRLTTRSGRTTLNETQTFSWGVLSLNTPRSVYQIGNSVPMVAGVVDENGKTVCNAKLTLKITQPNGEVVTQKTSDGTIKLSNACGPKSVTAEPDYLGRIRVDQTGTYRLHLEAETSDGTHAIDRSFDVGTAAPFVIERVAPTRINPTEPYLMHLFVRPAADYRGRVTDVLPGSFSVYDVNSKGQSAISGNTKTVAWEVDWKKGQEYELKYTFDAPNLSPVLFEIGPAAFGGAVEPRSWQIASDQLVVTDVPDVQYTSIQASDDDWDRNQPNLVQATEGAYAQSNQAVVKFWSDGFTTKDSSQPTKLLSYEIRGPENTTAGFHRAEETITKDGRERKVLYLVPSDGFRAGKYTLTAAFEANEKKITSVASFEWGTIGISQPAGPALTAVGSTVEIFSRNDNGGPECQGELRVRLNGPDTGNQVFSTNDGTIIRKAGCESLGPDDPVASFAVAIGRAGTHTLRVERRIGEVERHVDTTLTVADPPAVPEDVKRDLDGAIQLPSADVKATDRPGIDLEVQKDAVFGFVGVDSTARTVQSVVVVGPDGVYRPVESGGDGVKSGRSTLKKLSLSSEHFSRPGRYRLVVTFKQGDYTGVSEQSFSWGVLAVNVSRSIERPNNLTTIGMAVLDDVGRTLCDTEVTLEVTNPRRQKKTFSTKDGSVTKDPTCVDKGFTYNPDYAAKYQTDRSGTYTLTMTAVTPNGRHTITDQFEVQDNPEFDVVRSQIPTRIYPVENYQHVISITPRSSYKGTVVEVLPASFEISDISGGGKVAARDQQTTTIVWNVDWVGGELQDLKYQVDYPDVSPEFYLLGPLEIGTFREARQWQIASDSVGTSAESARLYSNGFELQSTDADEEYTANINTPVIDTSTFRSGAASMETLLGAGSTEGARMQYKSANTQDDYYVRAYINITTAPAAETKVLCFNDSTPSDQACIRMNTDRTLELWDEEDGPTQVTGTSSVLSTGTWYRIELRYDTTTLASTLVDARLDGASFSTGTLNHANGPRDLSWGILTSTTGEFNWDDIAINDDSGGAPQNWPDSGKIVHLIPNALVTNTCSSGDQSASLDDGNPDDGTTIVLCDANNDVYEAGVTDSGTAGIGASDLIRVVQGNANFNSISGTGTSTNTVSLNVPTNNEASGTLTVSTEGTFFVNSDAVPRVPRITAYDVSAATLTEAITAADIDATEIRFTTPDASPDVQLSTLWVMVEYVPAEGGRLYSSGFELQSNTAGVEYSAVSGTTSIDTTTFRSGLAALRTNGMGSGTAEYVEQDFKAANSDGAFFLRTYVRFATLPTAENRIIGLFDSGGTVRAYMTVTDSGGLAQLKLYDEDGLVGTHATIALNTWFRIETKFDSSGAGSTDIIESKVNGADTVTSSTRNLTNGITRFRLGANLNGEAQTTGDWYFDDVALNQNAGSTQNGYPGAGSIVHMQPDSTGDNSAWTNTNTEIDEITPDDGTSLISSTTLDQIEDVNLESASSAGIGSTDTVTLVSTGLRYNNVGTTAINFNTRLKDAANAGAIRGEEQRPADTTWRTHRLATPRLPTIIAYDRPHITTAWTPADLDSTQIGVRLTVDSTGTAQVSTLWLLVEYVPDPNVTVSGGCFTDAGEGTPCGDAGAEAIKVAVNGVVDSGTDGTVDGAWSFVLSSPPSSGAILTFFIDGEATESEEATTVVKYDGSGNVTLVKMYQSMLVIGADTGSTNDNATLTNADLATSGNGYENSDDEDVLHSVVSSVLTVDDDANKTETLYIIAGDTFRPDSAGGDTVTTHHVTFEGTLTLDNNALNVNGVFDNDGDLTVSTSTITFTAPSGTQFMDTDGTGGDALYNVVFNDGGGSATYDFGTTLDIDNDVSIIGGTFAHTPGFTVGGSWDNDDTFQSSGNAITFNATTGTKTIDALGIGSDTYGDVTFNDGGGNAIFQLTSALDVNELNITGGELQAQGNQINIGVLFNNDDTFTHGDNTILLYDSSGTDIHDFDGTGTDALYNLTLDDGGGSATHQLSTVLDVDNNLTITGGTLNANSQAITIGGNWDNDDTFTSGTATVTFDAADTNNTIDADGTGTDAFSSVTFAGSDGSGTWALNTVMDVAATLNVDTSDILGIDSGQTLTLSRNDASNSLTLNGTINGPGRLTYQNATITQPGFPSTGTLANGLVVRYDTVNGNLTSRGRTDYGTIEAFNSTSTNRTVSVGATTHTLSGNFLVIADGTGNTLFDGSTGTSTINVGGSLGPCSGGGSGSKDITFGSAVTWTVSTHVDFSNCGTLTSTNSAIVMDGTGNLVGNNKTFNDLVVDGTGNTVTVTGSITFSNNLQLGFDTDGDNDTLTINSGQTVTLSKNATTDQSLDLCATTCGTDTINGPGRLTFQNSLTDFPATGATFGASLVIRFDTVNGNLTIPARTDYGLIEAFGDSANARTVTLGGGTITTASHFSVIADAATPNHITLDGAANDPTLNIGGDFDFTGSGTASEQVTAPNVAATWSIAGNFNLTDGSWTAGAETVRFNGSATQTITFASQTLFNLTLTNASGSFTGCGSPMTTPGIAFAGSATVSNNFDILTQNVKVQFDDAGTYTFQNVNWNGVATDGIVFRSDTTAAWDLDINGTITDVSYVNVAYSDATLTAGGVTATSSTNCSNNTNWNFVATINVSGTVFQSGAEGSAFDCSGGNNIALRVSTNGGSNVNGSCTAANGTFTITGAIDPGAADIPVVVFSDSASSNKITTVTLSNAAATDITGLTLIIGRVVVTQQSGTSTTNAHLATADNGNAGIRYAVSGGNLTVESAMELHVLAGKTFAPGGNVTTTAASTAGNPDGDVHVPSTAVLNMAANTLSVGGDLNNAGTLTLSATQTTTMTATGSGFTITTGGQSLKNLTFNGASGGWTNSGALTVSENWTGTAGGFTQANSTTITVNGSAFSLASGFTWTKATSGANLILENATNLDFTDNNATKQDLGVVQIGASPGVTTLKTDMSATTVTIPTSDTFNTKGWDVTTTGAFACNGSCTLNLTDTAPNNEGDGTILDVGGDFTMSSSATFTSYTNSRVFMNSASGTGTNRVFTTGGKAYNDVELKNAGDTNDDITISGTPLDVNGNLTLTDGQIRLDTNDPNVTTAGNVSIASGATLTKADDGVATWTFDGTTAATFTDSNGTPQDIGLVTINKTDTVDPLVNDKLTLAGSMTVTKLIIDGTVNQTDTLDLASSGYTLRINGNATDSTVLTVSGTLTPGTNSTVQYAATATGSVNVTTTTYNSLEIAPGSSETYVLTGNLTGGNKLTGNLTNGSNSTLDTVSGSNFGVTLDGSWTNNGTFTAQNGVVTFSATGTGKTITGNITGSSKFYDLTFNGSGGGWSNSAGAMEVGNDLTMTAGTLSGTQNVTVVGGVVGTAGVINKTGGTFKQEIAVGENFGPTTANTDWTFSSLTFSNSTAGSLTVTTQSCSDCDVTVTGRLLVSETGDTAGTVLDAGNKTWTLSNGNEADPFDLDQASGSLTASTSTIAYNGDNDAATVSVQTATYSGLTLNPGVAEQFDIATGFTVSGTLNVGSNATVSIASGQTLTHTGTTLTLSGTITDVSDNGTFEYRSATAFPSTGTISSILRMNAINNAQSLDCTGGGRTFGGAVEFYNGHASTARIITLCNAASQIANFSSNITVNGAGGGAVTLEVNTNDPTVNVTGNLTTGTSGGGTETVSMGGGTWTVSGNVDFSNSTISNTTGGTLKMDGTGGKTLVGNTQSLYNLTIDPTSAATITHQTSNLTVANNITVATGDILSISAVSLTLSNPGTLTLSGTLSGGTLHYNTTATFPSTGTLTASTWFNGGAGTQTLSERTYGGFVQIQCFCGHTVVFGTGAGQTLNFSNNLYIAENSNGVNMTVDAATHDPVVNITGELDFNGNAGSTGQEILNAGDDIWTVGSTVDFYEAGAAQAGQYNPETNNKLKVTAASANRNVETAGNTLYDFEVATSGNTITLEGPLTTSNDLTITTGTLDANNTENNAIVVSGNLSNSGTFTARAGSVTMSGTSKSIGGSSVTSFYTLVVNGTITYNNISGTALNTSDGNITNQLTINAAKTLTLAADAVVRPSHATNEISWGDSASTITGSGRLQFLNGTAGPGTGGVVSSVTNYYSSTGVIAASTFDDRTYSGTVELYNDTSTTRTFTCDAGAYNISGASSDLLLRADGTGSVQMPCSSGTSVTIGRDFDYVGTGGGSEQVTDSGAIIWTVGRHFDLTGGSYTASTSNEVLMTGTGNLVGNGQSLYNLTINGDGLVVTESGQTTFTNTLTIGGSGDTNNDTLTINGTLTSGTSSTVTIHGSGTDTINGAGTLVMKNGSLSTNGTLSVDVTYQKQAFGFTAPARIYGGDVVFIDDFLNGGSTMTFGGGTWTISGDLTFSCSSDVIAAWTLDGATNAPTVNLTGDFTVQDGAVSCIFEMAGTWTASSDFSLSSLGTFTHSSGTLTMDAANAVCIASSNCTFTSDNKSFLNVSLLPTSSRTLTLAAANHTVAGNLTIGGAGTLDANSSTIIMSGNTKLIDVTASGKTLYNLTIDGNPVTLQTNNLTVSNTLTVNGAKQLTVTGVTLTLSKNAASASLSLSGTIAGTGRLTYQNSTTTFPTGGTISSITRFDAVNGDMTVPERGATDYGGDLELYNGSGSARQVTVGTGASQTYTVSGALKLIADSAGSNHLTVTATANDPAVTVTGTGGLDFTGTGAAQEILNAGAGNWTVSGATSGHVNFEDNQGSPQAGQFTAESGGTITMSGTGTLTSAGQTLQNLSITNASGTVTLASATHTLAGNLVMSGAGALTAGTSTIDMTGSAKVLEGGARTLNSLTITDNTTAQTSNVTLAGTLTLANSKTLTITSVTVTMNSTSAEVAWGTSSTISGTGTLTFTNGAGGPGTSGTLSTVVRFDATSGDVASTTFDPRNSPAYGGKVELYSNSTSARNITMAAGTYTLSGSTSHLNVMAANSADLTVVADTNNPTVTIGGDLDFTGSGSGFEVVAAGTGTWTVSGNVDLTNGIYGPSIARIGPSFADTARHEFQIVFDIGCQPVSIYSCHGSGITQYGGTDNGIDCINDSQDSITFTDRAYMQYSLSGINNSANIVGAQVGANVTATYSTDVNVARSTTDDINSLSCSVSSGRYSRLNNSTYGSISLNATGNKVIPLVPTGAADIQTRIASTDLLTVGLQQSQIEGTMGAVSGSVGGGLPPLYVSYYLSGTPTLTMNGSSKTLTSGGNSHFNLNLSGSITLADETHYVAGALDLTSGTITEGTSTIYMTGTSNLVGDAEDLYNLTIDGNGKTVTITSGLNVTNNLVVGQSGDANSDTLSISGSQTLTLTKTSGASLTISGSGTDTISGAGRLTYMTNTALPTSGTISSIFRYDATGAASQTITSRTYGGAVEIYNSGGTSKTVTSNSGTMAFSSTLDLSRADTATVTLDLNATDPTTTTVTGALTIGAGTTLLAPSTNAFNVNGSYTNNGTFTDNSGTVTLAGGSTQTLNGTMTGSSDFNHLTINNTSGSEVSPGVILDAAVDTSKTLTIAANAKVRFKSSTTYALGTDNATSPIAFNGTAGNVVYLRSSTPGTQWSINAGSGGTRTVAYTNIKDSNACGSSGGGITADTGTNIDAGNNACWFINTITFSISDLTIGFGTCSSTNDRFATGNAAGADTDAADAHTLTLSTNAQTGYSLTVFGPTLTAPVGTITGLGGSAVASSLGTEQFGLRAIKNSGAGTITSPFDTTNWAFGASATPQQIASHSGSASTTEIGVRYICNIAAVTEAGAYTTDLTYVLTGTF